MQQIGHIVAVALQLQDAVTGLLEQVETSASPAF
jgi:hypothetical protein